MTIDALHNEFLTCGRHAREWRRRCELLLPKIADHRVWKHKGFSSIYEYAAKLAGMSHEVTRESLRIARHISDKPALQQVAIQKGLNRVRPVATIATPENADFWAEKATEMSKNELETYVREVKYSTPNEYGTRTISHNVNITLSLPRETVERLKKLGKIEDLLIQLAGTVPYEDPDEVQPESKQTSSRHIPVSIKRHVLKKTSGACAFPGCHKPYKILHHTQRFALEAIHDPDRLVPLCHAHERMAHHGLIENEELDPVFWTIREHADPLLPKFTVDQKVALFRGG